MEGINGPPRSAAADDDGTDHFDFDAPRSGVATPQPDLHDKRLPGIMSYFGQVRPASFKRLLSGAVPGAAVSSDPTSSPSPPSAGGLDHHHHHYNHHPQLEKDGSSPRLPPSEVKPSPSTAASRELSPPAERAPSLFPHEMAGLPADRKLQARDPSNHHIHPYPTPPASQRSSFPTSPSNDTRVVVVSEAWGPSRSSSPSSSSGFRRATTASSEPVCVKARRPSLLSAPTAAVTESSVPARHLSNPCCGTAATTSASTAPGSPLLPSDLAMSRRGASSSHPISVKTSKELTDMPELKSGTSTPTRALSTAHPKTESDVGRENGSGLGRSIVRTPTPPGAQAPAAKGKLTIKIAEARGLRKCRDPYVVAVFQRSELISGGPRPSEEEELVPASALPIRGASTPMQRQGSDSGRPPMAIPMRSRQSSNTSITDYNTFRNRTSRRSFTNPKWDAEAVFDVVGSDMLVDVSVYGHGTSGEEFLGHFDFQAKASEKDDLVRGWFSLRGHADTVAENTPTGEIYVEAFYQRAERRHFGPDDFQILRLIGKGTFGQVYQVRKKDTKRIYAMKVLSKKVIVQKKEVAHTVGERNILVRTAMSDSPFIVGLKFSFQTPSDLYLVTDYMSGGELFWHLQKEGRFDEKRAKFYIAELILAIQHLHNNDIVYRDLKPENILLDANGHIALCDFGLSKANLNKNDTTNTFCGTTEYLAPEVLLDESGYTKMVDFWSLGVLVFEMCCGWSPFYAEDTQQMYKNIAFGKVRFPRDTLSLEGRNFVKGLLNRNPKHRLGATDDAEELKRHAFFQDVDWDTLSRKLITPPFKPKLKNETDVSYFDPEFTNALNANGSLNERAAALAKGYAASTPLSPSVQANFQGFTFVDESALEDHMKDRFDNRYEDEEMDDVVRRKAEDSDDLGEPGARDANRMSGIVKTSTNDEQMFGTTHFDDV